jgi:hypothetical protein
MGISPSGNRRQMEAQQYVHVEHASSIINNLLDKVADTLNLGRDSLSPQSLTTPDAPANGPVNDAMNQSNSLPSKETLPPKDTVSPKSPAETLPQNQQDITIVGTDGSIRTGEGDVEAEAAKQIIVMLKQMGMGVGGANVRSYILNLFETSNGLEIKATPKVGPTISKG